MYKLTLRDEGTEAGTGLGTLVLSAVNDECHKLGIKN